MDFDVCAQCGSEIEDKGIFFRKRHFCSDECCEEFEELFLKKGEPKLDELEVDDPDVLDDAEDLDFPDGDLEEDDDFLDDDFKIGSEDF